MKKELENDPEETGRKDGEKSREKKGFFNIVENMVHGNPEYNPPRDPEAKKKYDKAFN